MPKTIRQTATFKASARAMYGGYLEGVTIELVPNRKIVPFWRSRNWPPFYYSAVTFALTPTKGGTR